MRIASIFKTLCILCMVVGFIACDKSYESSIPSVQFSLSYSTSTFPIITTPGQFDKVNMNGKSTRYNHTFNRPPYGYAGILLGKSVFSTDNNEYVAFDAACPVEARRDVSVNLELDGLGTAICPTCQTKYNLSNGGFPEGIGTEYLKRYNVIVNGNTLIIQN